MSISFVCCPKPFTREFATLQENAIKSWGNLPCEKEIIICGKESGTKEFVEKCKHQIPLRWIPDIEYTKKGTPLVSSILEIVQAQAKYNTICYVNCDIILFDDFCSTLSKFKESF